jgi:hypothetical protein
MAFKSEQELEAYAEWAKDELRGMAEHVRSSDLFHEEVMGHAVWTLPHQVFIGKAWPQSNRNQAYWIISGPQLPTDHIDAGLAESAREAARHFSMKWQLQSGRLGALDEPAGEQPEDDVDWKKISATLQAQAEALYGLVEKDELWQPTQGPLVDPGEDDDETATRSV